MIRVHGDHNFRIQRKGMMTKMLMKKMVQTAAKKILDLLPSDSGMRVLDLSQQMTVVHPKTGHQLKVVMSTIYTKRDVIGLIQ